MTIQELIDKLEEIIAKQESRNYVDYELDHVKADALLLFYINNEEVTKAFHNIKRWYV